MLQNGVGCTTSRSTRGIALISSGMWALPVAYQLCQKLCQPLCQLFQPPLPQPPLCQLCQPPLPQPPLPQPRCQRPQPPLPHQVCSACASCDSGSAEPPVADWLLSSETVARIAVS